MRLILACARALSLAGGAALAQAPAYHPPPACWTAPRITHGAWSEQPGERAAILREKVPGGEGATWTLSPNGAYRFRKIDPDFTGPPPWNTRIVVDAEKPERVGG